MPSHYDENPGWEKKVLRSPEGRATIRGVANLYKDAVIPMVPVKDGELQAQYEKTGRVRSGKLFYGAPSMLYVTGVHIYHIIEWGSVNNPPYGPLRRAAAVLGLDWKGS
jgi:hypothetical protein